MTKAQRRRYNRIWLKNHPGYSVAAVMKWRRKNPAKWRASNKRYRAKHPERICASNHRRNAHKRNNGGSFTAPEWIALKKLYGNRCLGCGTHERSLRKLGRKLVPDHVRALAKRGLNSITNLQPLCHGRGGCNNRKGAKHIDFRTTSFSGRVQARKCTTKSKTKR